MLLALLLPMVVTLFGTAGLGFGFYALKKWAEGREVTPEEKEAEEKKQADAFEGNGEADAGGKTGPNVRCKRTGEKYDVRRWASPVHVATGMISLGYMVTPSLKTSSDKKQVKRFKGDAIKLGLRGLAGAPQTYVNSTVGPCMLLALSNAESLLKAGKWIKRPDLAEPTNWWQKMLAEAQQPYAGA